MKPFLPQKASRESLYSGGQGRVKTTNVRGSSPRKIPHVKEGRVQSQGDVQGHLAHLTSNPGKVNTAGGHKSGMRQEAG